MNTFRSIATLLLVTLITPPGMASGAGLVPVTDNFESVDALGNVIGDDWQFFNTVLEGDFTLFTYFGTAPNGPQISAIVNDQGGPDQMNQQLVVFSDYECCTPNTGHRSTTGNGAVRTSVFQQQTISSANAGETWTLSFDAKLGNIEGSSLAQVFLRVLNPNDGFSLTEQATIDMTSISIDWTRFTINLTLGDWGDQFLQFGFESLAGNFEGSGIFYDNIDFSPAPVPVPGALVLMLSGLVGVFGHRQIKSARLAG